GLGDVYKRQDVPRENRHRLRARAADHGRYPVWTAGATASVSVGGLRASADRAELRQPGQGFTPRRRVWLPMASRLPSAPD
ncbi:MAG: hypothetical protein N2438_04230, partial [Limisphaera sp.]|nr:hypothetical protein [Limisphaera sp.]